MKEEAWQLFSTTAWKRPQRGENLPRVLGYAIAHEIGHILLGQSSHAAAGLMRANWSEKDLKPVHHDQMQFTPEQAERMRTVLGSEMKKMRPSNLQCQTDLHSRLWVLVGPKTPILPGSERQERSLLAAWNFECRSILNL